MEDTTDRLGPEDGHKSGSQTEDMAAERTVSEASGSARGPAALIALDWGTSSLRAYLMGADGLVLETRSRPWGIMHLPEGDFLSAFEAITEGWANPEGARLPAIAAGMLGSAQGWVNAPYCPCPATQRHLADNLVQIEEANLFVVPGVAIQNETANVIPNVMRGEETQIFGVLNRYHKLGANSLFVLPGTHSKWVRIEAGQIHSFDTYMTGELFSVLGEHSILGRPSRDSGQLAPIEEAKAAFMTGVATARTSTLGITPRLFSARARVLAGEISPEASLDYLSGLLIGEEIRCGLTSRAARNKGQQGSQPLVLIGAATLCQRYQMALAQFGAPKAVQIPDASQAGLWSLASEAGLVRTANPETKPAFDPSPRQKDLA